MSACGTSRRYLVEIVVAICEKGGETEINAGITDDQSIKFDTLPKHKIRVKTERNRKIFYSVRKLLLFVYLTRDHSSLQKNILSHNKNIQMVVLTILVVSRVKNPASVGFCFQKDE